MSNKKCTKDDPRAMSLCSCDNCCRDAARSWTNKMDRVFSGDISLKEAIVLDENRV